MEAERDVQSEKEGEVEERSEERGIEESERTTEEACQEEERCEEEVLDSHSTAKRARVSAVFTDSQQTAIIKFVKAYPEPYVKENERFHDRHRKEAMWSEIAEELNLTPIDVKRWFESQRTRYGKLSKQQSGQSPRELTQRQSWVYEQMGSLKSHIRKKGANRSLGLETSATRQHDESRGSTTDGESQECSVRGSQTTLPLQSSTPVSAD